MEQVLGPLEMEEGEGLFISLYSNRSPRAFAPLLSQIKDLNRAVSQRVLLKGS